ncbi:hypothetical protein PR048_031713 [Dryococelus australis]|uniref:Uncharacterized protein n=1 Tax=Dryococelus australis TaxID=614101 RepID=A0ABQ9G626_9NEOP|nr:hypothetical protein PR048_031713 [Dryococelus australis]
MLAEPSTSGRTGAGSGEVLLQEDNSISESLFENRGKKSSKHQDNFQLDTLYLKDPGTWPDVINNTVRQQIVSYAYKYEEFVELSKTFSKDVALKPFSDYLLSSKSIKNRESYPRDWLVWSTSRETFHCLPRTLYEGNISAPFVSRSNLAKREGFSPSKTPLLVMLFLASRGLPFQGDSAEIGDVHNGNFLGTLELLGKYDEITHEHLAKVKHLQLQGKSMKGHAHYLSWTSQNEFISVCCEKVLNAILEERQDVINFHG